MIDTLIIAADRHAYYFERINNEQISIQNVFKDSISLKHNLLRLFRKMKWNYTYLYYGDWFKLLPKVNKIIVLDMALEIDNCLLRNISKMAPTAVKSLYSWNIIIDDKKYKKMKNLVDEAGFKYYCYDRGNCEKYNFHFNTIMYDRTLCLPKTEVKFDTIFVGFLKDKKDKLLSLYETFQKANVDAKFIIVDLNGQISGLPFEVRNQYIDYSLYLEMVNNSQSILDIVQADQDGFSMRVMESIFLNKKLITTNNAIKAAKFYNKNNILVMDLEHICKEDIVEFFQLEFQGYPESIRDYYSVESWVGRFV
ncbi:MAG: hypothetical protein K0S47_4269 [Herbinix sp.]|jgi:hypothetical protein|nr:hypothetical protein [Herbinix sp.]